MPHFGKIILTFAAFYLLLRFLPPIPIASTVTQKQDLFTVTGTGKVTVIPDTAIVNLGITVSRPTVKAAQTEANTIINRITSSLKSAGTAEKDIKTDQYSIYPQYDYQSGTNRITGYQVSTSLTVTVRNLEKINEVIDIATAQGANTISGVQFTVDETRQKELSQQARQEAVKEAKIEAESLSRSAGLTLGRIVNVQESTPDFPRPYFMATEKLGIGASGGGDTQVQPGSTDITSVVTLSYETR